MQRCCGREKCESEDEAEGPGEEGALAAELASSQIDSPEADVWAVEQIETSDAMHVDVRADRPRSDGGAEAEGKSTAIREPADSLRQRKAPPTAALAAAAADGSLSVDKAAKVSDDEDYGFFIED